MIHFSRSPLGFPPGKSESPPAGYPKLCEVKGTPSGEDGECRQSPPALTHRKNLLAEKGVNRQNDLAVKAVEPDPCRTVDLDAFQEAG